MFSGIQATLSISICLTEGFGGHKHHFVLICRWIVLTILSNFVWLSLTLLWSSCLVFNQVQAMFTDTESCVKSSKERTGCVSVYLKEGQYFLDLKCIIPSSYPELGVDVRLKEGNLPPALQDNIIQQAREKSRRLAEAPKVAQVVGGTVGREGAGMGEGSKSDKLAQNQTLSSRKMTGNLQVGFLQSLPKSYIGYFLCVIS